jgi:hypothetical protein
MDDSHNSLVSCVTDENGDLLDIKDIIELLLDFIFIHPCISKDKPGKFLQASRYACEWLGYSKEELLQLSPPDNIYGPELEQLALDRVALMSFKELVLEKNPATKKGDLIPEELYSSPDSLPIAANNGMIQMSGYSAWVETDCSIDLPPTSLPL